jgi:hypothetical protein
MSPLRAPRPPRELPHHATRLRTSPRRVLHPLHTSPHRGRRGKRRAQRRGRLRIPQPGRAALSPQLLPRMAATTSGHGKTQRRNTTRRRDKA